ncbi:von Hippel-Lindau disease tumor suppressor, beta/alpha domain-containing protein, partial [Mycena pura]
DSEPSLRSANSNTQTSVTFVNFRAKPIHLWWISFEATRVGYGTVAANGGRQDMTTYLTHPWVITDE